MRAPLDPQELAAVVVDGRAFDWSPLGAGRDVRLLSALWRAVRVLGPGELAGVQPARARLGWSVTALAALTLVKAAATAAAVILGPGAVNPMQAAILTTFVAVGTALLYGGVRDLRARHLGVLLLLLGSVMANPLLRQSAVGWFPAPLWLPALRVLTVEAFLPAALWLFLRDFPAMVCSPKDARWLQRGLRASVLVGCLLFAANLLLGAGVALPGLWMLDRGSSGTTYYWPLMIVLAAPALVVMVRRRRDAPPLERAKVNAFIWALALALVPALVITGLATRASPLRSWMSEHFALTAALLYVGLVGLPFTTSYAVLAQKVVRIELVLRNAARYALARGTLAIATVGPLVLLAVYAYRNRDMALGALVADPAGRSLLAMAAVAASLLVARQRLLSYIDRLLRRDGVSLASALDDFSRRSNQGLGLGDAADAVSRAVNAAFHPDVVGMLVADHARDAFVSVGAAVRPLARSSWLARALAGTRDPVVVDLEEPDGVARLLPRPDQEWLADAGAVVLVPLTATGGDVCAVLALGRMASTRPYADDDLRFLTALASAAAPTLEARLLRTSSRSPGRRLDDVDWDDESGRECRACGRVFAADANTCVDCAQPTVPMAIPVRLHGKFAVRKRLGAGGMGVVYLAQDEALDRPVALKALPGVQPEAVERLRREARAMARVSHPALATIHGVESWRAAPVLVVEYLAGGTLADRLKRGPMPEAEVVAIARQVLAGLSHLHRAGILHRDLKPSNIGFTADGVAKVLDFGLSRLVGGAPSAGPLFGSGGRGVSLGDGVAGAGASGLAGTPLYMSPEALDGQPADVHVDLWALAVLLREALAGGHPWASLGLDDVLQRVRTQSTPEEWRTVDSNPLTTLLSKALARDSRVRPQTADDFLDDLRKDVK